MDKKKLLVAALCAWMVLGTATSALAVDDILRIDGKNGKIYLEADEDGLNYPLKYLYDVSFWYRQDPANPDPTLGHVIEFLAIGRQEGFGTRVDLDKFINSALGMKTAEIWYPHILFENQMDPGLIQYWAEMGLKKEAFFAADRGDDGISGASTQRAPARPIYAPWTLVRIWRWWRTVRTCLPALTQRTFGTSCPNTAGTWKPA